MKYIITEKQYKLLEEEQELLKLPFSAFGDNWDMLQKFLERRGNPPYELSGDLDLEYRTIKSLGSLTRVNGNLILIKAKIKSLGNLEYVKNNLIAYDATIKSLGNLKYVGENLDLTNTQIKSLGNLEYVGNDLELLYAKIDSLGELKHVGGSLNLQQTPLSDETTQWAVRMMVNVNRRVHI